MKHVSGPCAGRGPFAAAALVLSGILLFHPGTAVAGNCGDGPLSATAGNLIGSAVGGAAGGLLGNQFGKGSGKGVMTGVGVVGGALAGGYVGRSLEDCGSRRPPAAAAPASYGVAGPARRRAMPRHRAAAAAIGSEARTCRFVLTQAVIDGREQQIEAITCLEPDGSWKTASGAAAEHAAEADLVIRAQQRLHDEGFYVRDNIDGRWGPATQAAVGNFQRAKGLPATGQLDIPTRQALGLDPSTVASAPTMQAGAAPPPPVASAPGTAAPQRPAGEANPVAR